MRKQAEPRFHIDRRAEALANKLAAEGDANDLVDTCRLARWLGVSRQFLEIGRSRGFGPRFIRLSSRRVRYRRLDVLAWLDERTHAGTCEYARGSGGRDHD